MKHFFQKTVYEIRKAWSLAFVIGSEPMQALLARPKAVFVMNDDR